MANHGGDCNRRVFQALQRQLRSQSTYNRWSLLRMLISAGIHYPRATPQMWPDLITKSKEGGADVIQTYVFWSGHEPVRQQYNFEGRYDLVKFVKLVGESGLYLHLRIGPYVCAEWNFGGLAS